MDLAVGHVAAIKKMFKEEFSGVRTYNLGTGKGKTIFWDILKFESFTITELLFLGVSVLEMVKAFEDASGVEVPYLIVPRRSGDVASCYASCYLAEKELEWKTQFSLYDMCKYL